MYKAYLCSELDILKMSRYANDEMLIGTQLMLEMLEE